MRGTHDATFWAQIDPTFYRGTGRDGDQLLSSIKVVGVTQSRPRRPKAGTVMVKLTIRVPDEAFYPLRPEAIVVIPTELTDVTPVEVTAEDPTR